MLRFSTLLRGDKLPLTLSSAVLALGILVLGARLPLL